MPVMAIRTHDLPSQTDLGSAVAALQQELSTLAATYEGFRSGCVRIEAALPGNVTALRWLAGQVADDASPPLLTPRVYFSARHSSAPDAPLSAQAAACTHGLAAAAGVGAAWRWQGGAAAGFDSTVMQHMQRFLAPDQPDIRVWGGMRFDTRSEPDPEWQELGAYLFTLPLLEYSERGSGAVLAVTVAWDTGLWPSHVLDNSGEGDATRATPLCGCGAASLADAAARASAALHAMRPPAPPSAGVVQLEVGDGQHTPAEGEWAGLLEELLEHLRGGNQQLRSGALQRPTAVGPTIPLDVDVGLAKQEYLVRGQQGLDELLAAVGGSAARPSSQAGSGESDEPPDHVLDPDQGAVDGRLSKVVAARRTRLDVRGALQPLWLLEALQERDPRAYQLYISTGHGTAFVACTPERLYVRSGRLVASEAVAGTRARGPPGDVERDFWLSMDLLRSAKDHQEFVLVRDWIRDALAGCAARVDVEVPKSVLKQGSMQHLYGRLAAQLRPGVNDSHILQALHPTPAVCGRPRDDAMAWLRTRERFDRGFYAGPFGWVSGNGAEFAVAIRSALVNTAPPAPGQAQSTATSHTVHLYAGVGVVAGSDPSAEWAELDLKTRPFSRFLQAATPLAALPNANLAWCALLVEECCRSGANMFCIAPGSRSSPLAAAVAAHPRARLNVCIDERSLAFWALGYGRATRRPAVVITSSGTAVANLLPAVVEAAQSGVPMLMVTADRPVELRDTGANQTIDQVKIFSGYVRWAQDISPPSAGVPGRALLTTVDTAMRYACGEGGATPGPVHLNMQLREPLAPLPAHWEPRQLLAGLGRWLASPGMQFTASVAPNLRDFHMPLDTQEAPALQEVIQRLRSARRGLLVAGELQNPQDATGVLRLARALGWPVVADVLSGLRTAHVAAAVRDGACLVPCADHVLLGGEAAWRALAPDVVLQVGPRLTSKRLSQFMEWAASEGRPEPATWLYLGAGPARHDAAHLISAHVCLPASTLADQLTRLSPSSPPLSPYGAMLRRLGDVAAAEAEAAIAAQPALCEPAVAARVSALLPAGHALLLGNSMPIRDMDMYASPRGPDRLLATLRVGANRGASGIDGVVSTAAGFAEGLARPTTLVIGDLSFLHDTNGLNMLRAGEVRPPLTVVLINNNGGGIFSFLPIAGAADPAAFEPLWGTPQNADFEGLCRAHGLPFQRATSVVALDDALRAAWALNRHSVVEVVTDRHANVGLHRAIQARVAAAVLIASAMYSISPAAQADNGGAPATQPAGVHYPVTSPEPTITALGVQGFSLPLARPLTTTISDSGDAPSFRRGLIVRVEMSAARGTSRPAVVGYGEVSPLPGLHVEDLDACRAQLGLLGALLPGRSVPVDVALLGGRLGSWLSIACQAPGDDLLPSVRQGLETALLDCLAQLRSALGAACSLAPPHLLPSSSMDGDGRRQVSVNALVSEQDPSAAAAAAVALVQVQGFRTLKLKVARSGSTPEADAAMVRCVRAAVGPDVALRADANRGWNLTQACAFGQAVYAASLEYLEEPTQDAEEATAFFQTTGVAYALDESVDDAAKAGGSAAVSALLRRHAARSGGGLRGVVLKPSRLGGFEESMALAALATNMGLQVVVSSAFEGPLGLAALVQLAAGVDALATQHGGAAAAHGLGTLAWFRTEALPTDIADALSRATVAPSVWEAVKDCLTSIPTYTVNPPTVPLDTWRSQLTLHGQTMTMEGATASATAAAPAGQGLPTCVFLHGFMGSKEDWAPYMAALCGIGYRCEALDLPGHGGSSVGPASVEDTADMVATVIRERGLQGCTLVGYSMGARIALATVLRHPDVIGRLACISLTPGIKDPRQAAKRAASDQELAGLLLSRGVPHFVSHWYQGSLWASLRAKPYFDEVVAARVTRNTAQGLASSLLHSSAGRMANMWGELPHMGTPALIISGELDEKYSVISRHVTKVAAGRANIRTLTIQRAGHAAQLERPWPVLKAILDFMAQA